MLPAMPPRTRRAYARLRILATGASLLTLSLFAACQEGPSDVSNRPTTGGQTGSSPGKTTQPSTPAYWAELTAGSNHTCARKDDGSVWCWGHNERGQLGNGALKASTTPQRVRGVSNAKRIAAGDAWTPAAVAELQKDEVSLFARELVARGARDLTLVEPDERDLARGNGP